MTESNDIQSLRARLSPAQRAQLEARLRGSGSSASVRSGQDIPKRDPAAPALLSHAQRSLWLTWQLAPESPAYNLAGSLRIEGRLDVSALAAALEDMAARHDILRTVIVDGADGQALQSVLPPAQVTLAAVDLAAELETESDLQRVLAAFAQAPFALDRELPWRAALYRLGAQRHVLALALHHIAGDGWSLRVLVDELWQCYEARASGRQSALAPLPIQFADYAAWERQRLDGGERERQLRYWREQLGSDHAPIELPTSGSRGSLQAAAEGRHRFVWPASLADGVRALARAQGVSLFMVMTALLDLLLYRLSGQSQIRVGTPIANRGKAETHGLIGYLLNLQVLQVQVAPALRFTELLRQVRQVLLDAQQNADLPFDLLVQALAPERLPGVHPLFQVKCTQQDGMARERSVGGLNVAMEVMTGGQAHFDLSLDFTDRGSDIECVFIHDSGLFEAALIEVFSGALTRCAEQVVAQPETALADFVLGHPERAVAPARACGAASVLTLWDAAVAGHGAQPALRAESRVLSFAELDAGANQLAARLRAEGIGRDDRVGVLAPRSPEFVLGLLAVLKAGAAYLPLDPELPPERLAYQLRDSGARLLLAAQMPGWQPGLPVWPLDAGNAEGGASNGPRPAPVPIHPEQAAYLIYTSGSTGQPKGVVVSHGALANYVEAVLSRMDLPAQASSMAMVSTVAADLGHTVLFGALCSGRLLHLISPERAFDPDAFAEYMHTHRVDVLKVVPSHLQALLAAARSAEVLPAHCLVLGGEATGWPLLDRIRTLNSGLRVLNHYGPTESTVGALAQVAEQADRSAASLPIGRPMAGMAAYLLDVGLQPVAPGLPGELYIGGAGLARGYQGRPSQSSERFVASPFGHGQRLYRTGDRGRMHKDGSVEFLGRADDQVKVRGYRVEPGEVAQVLRAFDGVGNVEVAARAGEDGRIQLVAYVVAIPGVILDMDVLKAQLGMAVPEYMVPSRWVAMAALPLSANGKVDRRALPDPQALASVSSYQAPQTEAERMLASVWADVLRVERVGREDGFFELGGDSILALQVVARARRKGLKLTPKQLIEHQVLSKIAALLSEPIPAGAPPAVDEPESRTHLSEPRAPSLDADLLARLGLDPAGVEDMYALGPMQQGLLLHSLIHPGSGMYVVQDHYRFDTEIDVDAFTRAWDRVVELHPGLRTGFHWETEASQVQIVHRKVPSVVSFSDWSDLDEREAMDRIEDILTREREQGFDLTRPSFLRQRLVRLAPGRYHLVQSFHHIMMDAWCRSIILVDFFSLYRDYRTGVQPKPPVPARSYRDFIDWLGRQDGPQSIEFWRHELAGFETVTPVPWMRERQAADRSQVRESALRFSSEETTAFQRVARQTGVTVNTLFQGAWALLLARLGNVHEALIGVTVSGRPLQLEGIQQTVGLFINSIPLRVSLRAPEMRTDDWLRGILARNLALREHEHVPLVQIQAQSELPRGRELFDTLFVFENAPVDASIMDQVRDLRITIGRNHTHTNYPLTVIVLPGAEMLLRLSYDAALFDQAAADRLVAAYASVLRQIAARPMQPLHAIELLSPPQKAAGQARAWGLIEDYSGDATYAELFEAQARLHGSRVAAAHGEQRVTYAELDARANCAAHGLLAQGVRRGDVVALVLGRGIDLLTLMLASFKAGAAYLAIDPSLPALRIDHLLRSSRARVVLALAADRDRLAAAQPTAATAAVEGSVRVLELTQVIDLGQAQPSSLTSPGQPGSPRQPAYLIYTSGSTGEPKGVVVSQKAMLNNQLSKLPYLALSCDDVIAQTASTSFDVSVWQHLAGLLCGARIEILPDEVAHDPAALTRAVAEQGITVLQTVPAMLQAMLDQPPLPLPTLRWMMPTGEASTVELARRWLERHPGAVLVNAYGPAECADDVALHKVAVLQEDASAVLPIGLATPNTQLLVLDRQLELQPDDVAGELFVAGVGLAQGYFGQPAATAERFVANPFSERGECLYRTGDLARSRPDGVLEYLGRTDHQVKIRGQRIELGEVEARIMKLDLFGEVAVIAAPDAAGAARLVAYVSQPRGVGPWRDQAQSMLERWLPAYMLPSAWVELEKLPRNGSGKVDRKRLPTPQIERRAFAPPQGEAEQALAAIWAELLGLPAVGRDDDFFELGGHSLLAIQVISRLRARFGVELPLRALFERPVLSRLAAVIGQWRPEPTAQLAGDQTAIAVRPRRDGEPPAPAQHRLWLADQVMAHVNEAGRAAYNMTGVIGLTGQLDVRALQQALNDLVARHESLRTAFVQTDEGDPAIRILPEQALAIESHDLSALGTEQQQAGVQEALRQLANKPFDLDRPPLLRVLLLQLGASQNVLCLSVHHIVFDGWSQAILARDLAEFYRARVARAEVALPPLRLQYADYAAWHRRRLQARLGEDTDFWTRYLQGAPAASRLPARPSASVGQGRGEAVDEDGAQVLVELPAAQLDALRRFARERSMSLFMLLLAVFLMVLRRRSGAHDVVVGTDMAGRDRLELEDLIGFFVNVLPVRSRQPLTGTFTDWVQGVRDDLLSAFAHGDLPFDQILDVARIPRGRVRSPLIQTLFVMQNIPEARIELPALDVALMEPPATTAKFDLVVFNREVVQGLQARWVYRADTHDRVEVQVAASEWRDALALIADCPDTPMAGLCAGNRQGDGYGG